MKKKLLIMLYVAAMLILVPSFAYGDVGPKPSVIIVTALKETYHVTLLSEDINRSLQCSWKIQGRREVFGWGRRHEI